MINILNGPVINSPINIPASQIRVGDTGSGLLTITDNATMSFSGFLQVGYSGTGEVIINNGASASATNGLNIGWQSVGIGTVRVSGAGSTFTSNIIYNGRAGTGVMSATDGATITANTQMHVGGLAGSSGVLTVTNGGSVTSGGFIQLGTAGTASGTITVDGNTSTLTANSTLSVGHAGQGTLTITNGGKARATNTYIGYSSGSTGSVSISGTSSNLENTGSWLMIGHNNTAAGTVTASLSIADGATVTNNGAMYVGDRNGATGTLTLTSGGRSTNVGLISIGANTTATGSITITGAQSLLQSDTDIYLGRVGTGRATVANGGTLRAGGSLTIGQFAGATGTLNIGAATGNAATGSGIIDVSSIFLGAGSGSIVFNHTDTNYTLSSNITGAGTLNFESGTTNLAGAISVNTITAGTVTGKTGAFTIANNNTVTSTVNTLIGNVSGSTGHIAVNGTGSTLESQAELRVGNSGNGVLDISNGGTVTSTGILSLGFSNGSQATATVTGANSLLQSSNADLRVGYSGTAALTVSESAAAFAGSYLYVGQANNGNGTLNILSGGKVTSTGQTQIGGNAGATGTIHVNGAGSNLTANGELRIANNGNGNLTVTNGASVRSAVHVQIGTGLGTTGTVIIDGDSSSLTADNFLYVGRTGQGSLTIQNGATAQSVWSTRIGYDNTGNGNVVVNGTGSTLTSQVEISLGGSGTGTLTLANGGKAKSTNTFHIAQNGGSTGTLNIGAADGQAATGAGIVEATAIAFGAGTGKIVFNHTDENYILSSNISGNGTLDFLSGTTILTGNNNAHTGIVNVNGGALRVNGSMGSLSTTVESGGRFGGNSTIGSLIVNSGGTLAPGNSIGVTNAADATFNPGSVYEVELNAAMQSDLLNVTNIATLNGGTVRVIPYPDYALGTPYTIITAGGGVVGAFDGVTPTAFFTGQLAYIGNDVLLTLAPRLNVAQTVNQAAVANATAGASGNAAINALYALPDQVSAQQALNALSGEIHASLSSAQIREQNRLRSLALMSRPQSSVHTGGGTAWVHALGTQSRTKGDDNIASVKDQSGGILMGMERHLPKDRAHIGFAAGYSLGDTGIDARHSDAQSNNYHLLAYGDLDPQWDGITLNGGAAFTWHDIETTRDIGFTGLNSRSQAEYQAQTSQIFIGAGKDFKQGTVTLRPYASAAYIYHHADSFTENGTAGLHGKGTSNHIGMTEMGIDAKQDITLDNAQRFTIEGGLGWQHAIGDTDVTHDLSFRDTQGTNFTVEGTSLARDAMTMRAGVSFSVDNATDISLRYDGSLATDQQTHAAGLNLNVKF